MWPDLDRWLDWLPFALGWMLGWAMLARNGALPSAGRHQTSLSVIVPARNEAASLPLLLTSLRRQLAEDDELIVVDDDSTDQTATIAHELGATVISAGRPPAGWLGKPHACCIGARRATGEVLVFVDADVRAEAGLLDDLAAAVADTPDSCVSVQPWHVPERPVEQLGMFGNLAALMGTGRWSWFARSPTSPVAFGAVLAIDRGRYESVGGHAAPSVRRAVTEDVELARLIGSCRLYTGRGKASFRMYPAGWRDIVDGWTRVLAAGIGRSPIWAVVATSGWLWALAAAPIVGVWAYLAAVVQVAVLSRRAGRFPLIAAALYPIPLAAFVVLTLRSVLVRLRRRDLRWKSRTLHLR